MVMQHDVRSHQEGPDNSSSFIMSRFDDEADVVACCDSVNVSTRSATRDTTNTTRDYDLDNTRQTVNTRDSILDFSKEDDEDDISASCGRNHNDSILFGELHEYPTSIESTIKAKPTPASLKPDVKSRPVTKKSIMEGLTLYSVTDSFVDSLCNSTVCVTSSTPTAWNTPTKTDKFKDLHPSICTNASSVSEMGCGNWPVKTTTPTTSVSVDVWELLGCATSPGETEVEEIWNLKTGEMIHRFADGHHKIPPARASIKRRLKRIHGLRMERVSGASRHGVTISNRFAPRNFDRFSSSSFISSEANQPHVLEKVHSMLDDPLANLIGQGIDPIPMNDDEYDGYDSDPEVNCSFQSSSLFLQPASVEHHEVMQVEPLPVDETEMKYSVQVIFILGCCDLMMENSKLTSISNPVQTAAIVKFYMDIDVASQSRQYVRV
jgi:hypothetical protein